MKQFKKRTIIFIFILTGVVSGNLLAVFVHPTFIVLQLLGFGLGFVLYIKALKKEVEERETLSKKVAEECDDDYMMEGTMAGVLIGVMLDLVFDGIGSVSFMSLGITLGIFVGMLIPKGQQNDKQDLNDLEAHVHTLEAYYQNRGEEMPEDIKTFYEKELKRLKQLLNEEDLHDLEEHVQALEEYHRDRGKEIPEDIKTFYEEELKRLKQSIKDN